MENGNSPVSSYHSVDCGDFITQANQSINSEPETAPVRLSQSLSKNNAEAIFVLKGYQIHNPCPDDFMSARVRLYSLPRPCFFLCFEFHFLYLYFYTNGCGQDSNQANIPRCGLARESPFDEFSAETTLYAQLTAKIKR